MGKVGVLVYTNKIKERSYKKEKDYMDSYKNYGLNKVLSQLKYDYEYCSPSTINNYEYVLVSITSYYDILNLVSAIPDKRKCKVIVGGAGVNNIRGYLDKIDYAWFGRCDSGEINGIIEGKEYKSLWIKTKDPEFINKYEVGEATRLGYEGEEEKSVGCTKKCYFCHYSFWNKYVSKEEKSYKSGFRAYEDFFQSIEWERGRIISAMDGMTEATRVKVNKALSIEEIKEKLLEINKINREKRIALKIYSIIGYPWETKEEISRCDLIKALKQTSGKIKTPILMYFHLSHFVPMQKTPMWWEAFNFNNYAYEARKKPLLYQDDKITLYTGTSTTSPASAGVETIIQRATNIDQGIISKIATKKFQAYAVRQKVNTYKGELSRFFCEQEKESIDNIITPYKYKYVTMKRG